MDKNYTLGKLYSGIRAEKKIESEEIKPKKIEDPKFVKICKSLYKKAPQLGTLKEFKPDLKSAIEFLGWKLSPKEYDAALKFVSIVSIVSAFIILIFTYIALFLLQNVFENLNPLTILKIELFVLLIAVFGIIYYFMKYPFMEVEKEQRKSLVYMPEMIGYLTMSLKLVPNLEKAIKFAALQGKGKLAEDFKKLLWDVNIGVYNTVEEALDFLAYRWKKYSSEFKEAIMMIKSSMVEDSDARRAELLDKTTDVVLESIKIKMEGYARALSQPSLVLFYVGILLPLLLVILLPIGSVFANLPFANPIVLALIYDVGLPLFVFLYARHVINSMPSLYKPPTIPDKYPGLPKKGNIKIGKIQVNLIAVVIIVFILGIAASVFLQIQFGTTLKKVMINEQLEQRFIDDPDSYFEYQAKEAILSTGKKVTPEALEKKKKEMKMLFIMQPGHDITPYYIIYGFALSLALAIFLYFFFSAYYKKKVQDYYIKMENEFKEILYILASRLGEGKPMEQALKSTKEFFPDLSISQDMLAKTLDNLNLLGLPLNQAFFDPMFGSLKNNPSMLIKNNIKLIVDAVQLGVHTGAKTILSIIVQLKNIDEIRELVKKVTTDIVQMMNTMATMIAPAVLGITNSMQKIVVLTLNSLASSNFASKTSNLNASNMGQLSALNPSQLMGSFKMEAISKMATPTTFNIIIIIYVVLLVIILSYFTSRLQEDNPLATKMLIAYTVPIAIIIYIVAAFASSLLLGG